MKIYRVTVYDDGGNASYYFCAYQKDAKAFGAAATLDEPECSYEIDGIPIERSRHGTCGMLNDLIAQFHINQGEKP